MIAKVVTFCFKSGDRTCLCNYTPINIQRHKTRSLRRLSYLSLLNRKYLGMEGGIIITGSVFLVLSIDVAFILSTTLDNNEFNWFIFFSAKPRSTSVVNTHQPARSDHKDKERRVT